MNCHEARSELYTFLDGETRLLRRLKIRWHLRRCPPCEDGRRFEEKLKQRVREGCTDDLPPELAERLLTFIREQDDDYGEGVG